MNELFSQAIVTMIMYNLGNSEKIISEIPSVFPTQVRYLISEGILLCFPDLDIQQGD
jgi:hypothetical protein